MPSFPVLKTGAVMQYPACRQLRFNTQICEFMDGTEQRFREFQGALRRWVVRLELLEASELQALAGFVDEHGTASAFAFTDPWDGTVHANCMLESPEFSMELLDEWNGRAELTIRENRT